MFCAALVGSFNDQKIAEYFRIQLKGDICVVESENAVRFNCPGVTVIKKNSEADLSHFSGTIIVSSENTTQLKRMLKLDNPVITCGMCSKDTITCTSRTEDTAVIALQRPVSGLEAPWEILVGADESEDIYHILALEAVKALSKCLTIPQA